MIKLKDIPESWWIGPMDGCIPEHVYQAFKARLVAELSQGEGAVVFVPINPKDPTTL